MGSGFPVLGVGAGVRVLGLGAYLDLCFFRSLGRLGLGSE